MRSRSRITAALGILTLIIMVVTACGQPAPPAAPTASSSSAPPATPAAAAKAAAPETPAAAAKAGQSATPAAPAAKSAALDGVIEAAKKEGKLTAYASYTAQQGKDIFAAFTKKYPFIQVEHVQVSAGDMATRVLLESRSGTPGADIMLLAGTIVAPIIKEGFAKKVDWASLGAGSEVIVSPYQVAVGTVTHYLVWNTKLVPAAEAPKTWDDLLDPKWKGKIGLWANPDPIALLAPAWGEAKAVEYTQKLMQNDPVVLRGGADVVAQVGAGSVSVAIGIDTTLNGPKQAGAPIDWALPDPVTVSRFDAVVPTLAQHPNAAILYALWLTSPEGAAAQETATGRGNFFVPESPLALKAKGKKLSMWPDDKFDAYSDLVKRLTPIVVP